MWHKPKTVKRNRGALGYASTACTRKEFTPTGDQHSIAANSRKPIRAFRSILACRSCDVEVTRRRLRSREDDKLSVPSHARFSGWLIRLPLTQGTMPCARPAVSKRSFCLQHVFQGENGQPTNGNQAAVRRGRKDERPARG